MSTSLNHSLDLNIEGPIHILTFTFVGYLERDEALVLIGRWEEFLATQPNDSFILVWDARDMTGYDPGARTFWQQAMKRTAKQTEKIWLISERRIIRLGANLMSIFSKVPIRAVVHPSEVEISEAFLA